MKIPYERKVLVRNGISLMLFGFWNIASNDLTIIDSDGLPSNYRNQNVYYQ